MVSATNSAGSANSPVSNEVMIAEAAAQGEPQQAQSNQQQSSQPQQTSEQAPPPAAAQAIPTSNQGTQPQQQSTTMSRDETLFNLHDETAKQIRRALDNWQEPVSQEQLRAKKADYSSYQSCYGSCCRCR